MRPQIMKSIICKQKEVLTWNAGFIKKVVIGTQHIQ